MTLKLWADRRTDAAKSCCSPLAVLGARELAHSLGIPHLTLDLEPRVPRARSSATSSTAIAPGGPRTRAWSATASCGSTRCSALADRLGCSAARHRPLRAARRRRRRARCSPPPPTRPRTRPTCSPASRPASLARLRFPLAELTKPRGARARRRGRARGRLEGREPGPLLSRRRGQARVPRAPRRPRRAPGRDRRSRRAARSGATAATTSSRSASGAGSGSAAREPLLRARHRRRRRTRSSSGRARSSPRAGSRSARRPCTARAAGVDRVLLRYHSRPLACAARRRSPRASIAELELELAEPAYGVAPGQTACLLSRRDSSSAARRSPDGRTLGCAA